jgi:putative NADH-flavin reductase
MQNDIAMEPKSAERSHPRALKLVVMGATGGTGLEIVRKAIERGHSVTAFVRSRSAEKLRPFQDRIAVTQGDLLNSVALERVIQSHDAVVSGFGPRIPVSRADANLLQQFAVVLTSAMLRTKVRRVVVESVAFLFKDSIFPPAYPLGRILFPGIVADASAMEDVLERSGLDWTIVRPPELTDKSYTGNYRVREGHLPRFGFKISRADVADFMVKALENPSSIGKIIGISN